LVKNRIDVNRDIRLIRTGAFEPLLEIKENRVFAQRGGFGSNIRHYSQIGCILNKPLKIWLWNQELPSIAFNWMKVSLLKNTDSKITKTNIYNTKIIIFNCCCP